MSSTTAAPNNRSITFRGKTEREAMKPTKETFAKPAEDVKPAKPVKPQRRTKRARKAMNRGLISEKAAAKYLES